mmetsp:Transcript_50555/g.152332  ORF Transcript_50555/g.152332 Transcript_50555/m.152332 type:complete len:111 (-) Transcript_50555:293-625(-)
MCSCMMMPCGPAMPCIPSRGRKSSLDTFDEMAIVTKQFLSPNQAFLLVSVHLMKETLCEASHCGEAMKILWPHFAPPLSEAERKNTRKRMKLDQPPKASLCIVLQVKCPL